MFLHPLRRGAASKTRIYQHLKPRAFSTSVIWGWSIGKVSREFGQMPQIVEIHTLKQANFVFITLNGQPGNRATCSRGYILFTAVCCNGSFFSWKDFCVGYSQWRWKFPNLRWSRLQSQNLEEHVPFVPGSVACGCSSSFSVALCHVSGSPWVPSGCRLRFCPERINLFPYIARKKI